MYIRIHISYILLYYSYLNIYIYKYVCVCVCMFVCVCVCVCVCVSTINLKNTYFSNFSFFTFLGKFILRS